MSLPNPGMDAVPFTPLTAAFLDQIIANVEALADGTGQDDASIAAVKIDPTTVIRFAVTKSASQTGITSAALTQVSFNTEEYDVGAAFASNVFTAPVDGLYHFSANLQGQATTTGNTTGIAIFLRKNGSSFRGGYGIFDNNISADFLCAPVSADILLSAGQTVDVAAQVYASAGTVLFAVAGATFFTGHLVVRT